MKKMIVAAAAASLMLSACSAEEEAGAAEAAAAPETAAAAPAPAAEETKPHPDLAYRHHAMETIKDSLGSMFAIMKGEADAAGFTVHANALAGNAAAFELVAKNQVKGGETLEAAWENYADFSERMAKFTADSAALAALGADATAEARGAALKEMTSNCKACHDKYREEH